jgi:glycosyltransferase involved in cell wall biosynthesis
MRRLLMITYFFPPVGGVGIERSLKHVTYLPDAGWEPVVVAPSNAAYRIVDPTTLERVPAGTEIHRAPSLEPAHLRLLLRRLRGRAATSPEAAGGGAGAGAGTGTGTGTGTNGNLSLGTRLRAMANAAWAKTVPLVMVPDEQLLWTVPAIVAGVRAHRREDVDAIYSSSPPASSHLAAAVIKSVIDRPWIADFRDPWMQNPFARQLSAMHGRLEATLERLVVERADAVVLATGVMREQYAARYPELADRFVHIPNGYDLDDLHRMATDVPITSEKDLYRIVYAGSLYGEPELRVLLDGVALLLERWPGLRSRLRIDLVGWLSATNQQIAARRLPELEPVVRTLGLRPRAEALGRQRAADACLVLMGPGDDRAVFGTTKLFEYLGLGLPVLAVVPPGEVRHVLAELDWGVVADPTPQGVADGIERLMAAPPRSAVADPERRYERRALTRRLAAILDEVTSGT